MGQAAVDLPDPVGGTSAAHAASADDLLSQLAGDEIDRLLAEADVEAEAQKTSDTPDSKIDLPEHEEEEQPAPDLGTQIDSALEKATTPVEPATPVADLATPSEATSEPVVAPPTPSTPEAVENSVAAPAEPSSAAGSDEETSAQERSALAIDESANPATDGSNSDEIAAIATKETLPPLPIYLRPLEWLNAPLAACSEPVREAVGKVAIITLVNAVAVLAYVLIVRK